MTKFRLTALTFLLAFAIAPQLHADSLTVTGCGAGAGCGGTNLIGSTFTVDVNHVSGDNYTATYTIHLDAANFPSTGDIFLKYIAFKINGSDLVSIGTGTKKTSGPANFNDLQLGGGNANGCSGAGSGFLCLQTSDANIMNLALAPGDTIVFGFNLQFPAGDTPDLDWSIKALFESPDTKGKLKNAGQISLDGESGHHEVPEPTSLVLLGSGLLGAGNFVRRKLNR